ncbi:CHAT domain-containing protein [Vitiosangium sp. GDMCC 1.1324]|uniref:CHAT domain-containing protein n=1 Tax=Vitiosangium sp. (strain GDMCC 1.1324) TaxID=2138576 RepID=UPI00130D7850|nr:CHAT domain-containing protein [Vitiosangium sp. GDMCC 1.1324]
MAHDGQAGGLSCRFELVHGQSGHLVRFLAGGEAPIERPFGFELSPTSRSRGVIARIEQGICTRPDLQDVGSQLWNALRPPGIQEAFAELERQADESRPLRVWLDVPPEADVERLPWEALHDEMASSFLGTDLRYCLSRTPPRGCPPCLYTPRGEQPIRVLVVIPEGSGLQVQYEWNNLRNAARDLRDVLHLGLVEGRVTPDHLQAELRSSAWDVLHFIGHGEAGEEGISIRLNGEEPGTDLWMDASTFASLVQGQHVRLALLNCCLGASPSVSRTLSGLGPHLMRTARVPAVIAMRYEISDTVSIRFADSFYRELLTGRAPGRVDTAVQQARHALRINASGDTIRGFVTPVLYLSPGCEQLFDVRPAPGAPVTSVVEPITQTPVVPLPRALVASLREGRCIPVVGPGLHPLPTVTRRHVVDAPAPAPTLSQLIHRLARESEYPEADDLRHLETAGDWILSLLLARVCQHYQHDGRRYRLIESLQAACGRAEPPGPLLQIASWDVPGIFYLHFDGLMEEALKRARKMTRVLNRVDQPQAGGEHTEPLLVNVLGTLTYAASLMLTEMDHEHLWERLPRASSDVVGLVRQMGRSFLFLGASPRDLLVRRLCLLLETGEASMQGPCFFVSREATEVDSAYWKSFNVRWIREEPSTVIDALTARLDAEDEA